MNQLGIVLPTNRPDEYFNVIHGTIQHLKPMLKKVEVWFLFNFQPPWNPTQIKEVEKSVLRLGFKCKYLWYTPSKRAVVSMNKLREDCCQLLPTATWWMFADDNMAFAAEGSTQYPKGSAARYLEVLDYLKTFPNCAVVMCEGSLGGAEAKLSIRPTRNGLISTTRGLFYRNILGQGLYTATEYAIKGGLCEIAPAYRAISQGFFAAKQFNNPTRHLHKHRMEYEVGPLHIGNYEKVVKPNLERYIRELYKDPEWTLEKRYIPKEVWRAYRASLGDPAVFERPSKYWKDYKR